MWFAGSVGYCQSLNYLGGIVVVVVDAEEDCFWLLSAILEFLLPKTSASRPTPAPLHDPLHDPLPDPI